MVFDSGTSKSLAKNKADFKAYNPLIYGYDVQVANDAILKATGSGTIEKRTKEYELSFKADYVEGLAANLISVRQMTKKGYVVIFKGNNAIIKDSNGVKYVLLQQ